jgi:hypothetical protein
MGCSKCYGLWGMAGVWLLKPHQLGGHPNPMGYHRLWVITGMGYHRFYCRSNTCIIVHVQQCLLQVYRHASVRSILTNPLLLPIDEHLLRHWLTAVNDNGLHIRFPDEHKVPIDWDLGDYPEVAEQLRPAHMPRHQG